MSNKLKTVQDRAIITMGD